MPIHHPHLVALASYLTGRRDAILAAWHQGVRADADPAVRTALLEPDVRDRVLEVIQDFERTLAGTPPMPAPSEHPPSKQGTSVTPMQPGDLLPDPGLITRELGRLNECVVAALDEFCMQLPRLEDDALVEARRSWAELYSVASGAIMSRLYAVQQARIERYVSDLEHALERMHRLESETMELWRQAAHDLRGNLSVVANVTAGLTSPVATESARVTLLGLLDRSVHALHLLLEDVTSLVRLQGGHERRIVTPMDGARVLHELCDGLASVANERGLFLRCSGPSSLAVEGDAVKLSRIIQNLVLNAVKYTRRGGIYVSWGECDDDPLRWFVQVKDTGPGFHAAAGVAFGAPAAAGTSAGAANGRPAAPAGDAVPEQDAGAPRGEASDRPDGAAGPTPSQGTGLLFRQSSEGIGLLIVKRLCNLLDAAIEMDSKIDDGTTFTVSMPKRYRMIKDRRRGRR